MDDLYKILNIERTATLEEVKQAYKLRAKETHPDMEGGSEDEFKKVNEAYKVLSNPIRRDKYDNTGEVAEELPFDKKFKSLVQEIFITMIEAIDDIESTDLIERFKENVNDIQMEFRQRQNQSEKKLAKFSLALSRVKGGEDTEGNSIAFVIQNNINQCERAVESYKENIAWLDEVLEHLKLYTWDYETGLKKKVGFLEAPSWYEARMNEQRNFFESSKKY